MLAKNESGQTGDHQSDDGRRADDGGGDVELLRASDSLNREQPGSRQGGRREQHQAARGQLVFALRGGAAELAHARIDRTACDQCAGRDQSRSDHPGAAGQLMKANYGRDDRKRDQEADRDTEQNRCSSPCAQPQHEPHREREQREHRQAEKKRGQLDASGERDLAQLRSQQCHPDYKRCRDRYGGGVDHALPIPISRPCRDQQPDPGRDRHQAGCQERVANTEPLTSAAEDGGQAEKRYPGG